MKRKLATKPRQDLLISLAFLLVAAAISYVFVARPAIGVVQARAWSAVPCTILSSGVETNGGKRGTTYRVNVVYAYEINGAEHRTNRYDFLGASSSDYESNAAIVEQFRPGVQGICYVDPADPASAVLNRDFTSVMWLGLIPLSGVVIGFIGIVSSIRKMKASVEAPPAS